MIVRGIETRLERYPTLTVGPAARRGDAAPPRAGTQPRRLQVPQRFRGSIRQDVENAIDIVLVECAVTAAVHLPAQQGATVCVRAGEDDTFRRQTGAGPDALAGGGGAVVEPQPFDGDQQQRPAASSSKAMHTARNG